MIVLISNYTDTRPNLVRLVDYLGKRQQKFVLVRTPDELLQLNRSHVTGFILSGSNTTAQHYKNHAIVRLNVMVHMMFPNKPKLCICFAHQLFASFMGGTLKEMPSRVSGAHEIQVNNRHSLFRGLPSNLRVWMLHRTCVASLPSMIKVIGENREGLCKIQAYHCKMYNVFGVQFHPEARDDTQVILDNFLALTQNK